MWFFRLLALGFLGGFFLYYQKRQSFERNGLVREIEDLKKKYEVATQNLRMEEGELETVMSAISDAILAVDKEGRPIFF